MATSNLLLRRLAAAAPRRGFSGASASASPHRRSSGAARIPPHEYTEPSPFIGSWEPIPLGTDPRVARARLARHWRDYRKQVTQLRKEYAHEVMLLKAEKDKKEEARKIAEAEAKAERKAAKAKRAEARAEERKGAQDEFKQMLMAERAQRLENWKATEALMEERRKQKRERIRLESSMWIPEENLQNRLLEAIVDSKQL